MNVILAISPQESHGLLEFALEAAGAQFQYFQRITTMRQLSGMDVMILDPDQPGQDFLLRYRKVREALGSFPLIVLGAQSHITMQVIPWAAEQTTFLEGEQIFGKLQALLGSIATPQDHAQPLPSPPAAIPHNDRTIELFKGLHNIHLSDIVQMLCLSRWSGEIRVYNKKVNCSGNIGIAAGEVVNAHTVNHRAENACYEMLAWESCEFHFMENAKPCPRTIFVGWEALLMEAACRIDEARQTQVC